MKSYPLFGHEKKIIRDNSHSICNVYILLFMLILPIKEFFDVPGLSRAFIGAALVVLQWVEKKKGNELPCLYGKSSICLLHNKFISMQ